MFKLVSVILAFIRELVFDADKEHDFKSHKFNSRKFMVLIMIVLSFTLNLLLIYRIVHLADKRIEIENKLRDMEEIASSSATLPERQKLIDKLSIPAK